MKKGGLKRELGQACKNRLTDNESINRLFKRYKTEMNDNGVPQLYCAQMIMNLSLHNLDVAKQVFDTVSIKSKTEGLYTNYIKCLCAHKLNAKAIKVLQEMDAYGPHPHIRTFIPFFEIPQMDGCDFNILIDMMFTYELVPTLKLFELIFKHTPRAPKNYDSTRLLQLLQLLSNHYHEVTETLVHCFSDRATRCKPSGTYGTQETQGMCDQCNWKLARYDATMGDKVKMMECLKYPGIEKLKRFLNDKNIDTVIDGSNVAMYNNSPFNFKKVYKLMTAFPKDKTVLLVFHIGRKKSVDKQIKQHRLTIPKNVYIWYSKIGEDDDLSWLYATLAVNGKCVTSDKLRDHLFLRFSNVIKGYVFDKWVERHVIDFKFIVDSKKGWIVKLFRPQKWSTRTNYDVDHLKGVHFPVNNPQTGKVKWWCSKI